MLNPLPAGLVADDAALFGLLGLMANANAYSQTLATVATAGTATVLTAAQALAGCVRLTTGASGGFTVTLPTTKALITALGPTIQTDGTFAKRISFLNDGVGQTGTLTAGDASTTITGTATFLTDTRRDYMMTVTGAATITFQNLGSAAI